MTLLVAYSLRAQSLTEIRGLIHQPDGSLFSGDMVITPDSGPFAGTDMLVTVNQGMVNILLASYSTDTKGTPYSVLYTSDIPLWKEQWLVPVSSVFLSPADVIQPSTPPPPPSPTPVPSTSLALPIQINQVLGLSGDLASINNAVSSLDTSVNNSQGLNSTVDKLSNSVATLSGTTSSLTVQVNSQSSSLGSLNNSVSALSTNVASQGNSLSSIISAVAALNTAVSANASAITAIKSSLASLTAQVNAIAQTLTSTPASASVTIVDSEVPTGTIDSVNPIFFLANAPNPVSSLQLYENGMLLHAGSDYTLQGTTITFTKATVPMQTDELNARYRY